MALVANGGDGFADQIAEVDLGQIHRAALFTRPACLQHLLDGAEQAFVVGEHYVVKLGTLFGRQVAGLQRLEVELDRGYRGFEFVSDSVEKGVVLFVAADLTHQKDRVENQARDDQGKKDDAEHQQHDLADVEQYPPDIEGDRQDRKDDPEYQKEDCCLTPPHI